MSAHLAKKVLTTVALLACFASVTTVYAHAYLKSETPVADSTSPGMPGMKELRLTFTQGVEINYSKVTVTHDGKAVPVKSIENAPSDKQSVIVTLSQPLSSGEYRVEWHVTSVDTHKTEGHYRFKIAG